MPFPLSFTALFLFTLFSFAFCGGFGGIVVGVGLGKLGIDLQQHSTPKAVVAVAVPRHNTFGVDGLCGLVPGVVPTLVIPTSLAGSFEPSRRLNSQ